MTIHTPESIKRLAYDVRQISTLLDEPQRLILLEAAHVLGEIAPAFRTASDLRRLSQGAAAMAMAEYLLFASVKSRGDD